MRPLSLMTGFSEEARAVLEIGIITCCSSFKEMLLNHSEVKALSLSAVDPVSSSVAHYALNPDKNLTRDRNHLFRRDSQFNSGRLCPDFRRKKDQAVTGAEHCMHQGDNGG